MVIKINVFKRINPLGLFILNLHHIYVFSFLCVYTVYKLCIQYTLKNIFVKRFS